MLHSTKRKINGLRYSSTLAMKARYSSVIEQLHVISHDSIRIRSSLFDCRLSHGHGRDLTVHVELDARLDSILDLSVVVCSTHGGI